MSKGKLKISVHKKKNFTFFGDRVHCLVAICISKESMSHILVIYYSLELCYPVSKFLSLRIGDNKALWKLQRISRNKKVR
jgi:hypothetical protein